MYIYATCSNPFGFIEITLMYIYIYEATVCQERSTPEIAEPEQPEAYSLECVYTGAETEGMLQSIYIYTCIYDVFLKYFIDF